MLTLDKIYHAAFVLKKVARKTDLINKLINIVHRGELAPARLVYTDTV